MLQTSYSLPEYNEVNLPNAPLVAVVAQVSFASLLSVKDQALVAKFQTAIRDQYPIFKAEKVKTNTIDMAAGSLLASTENPIWRFSDATDTWRLSVSPDFVAVDTKKYTNRQDFIQRLMTAVSAAESIFAPGLVTRVGVRFIDRLDSDALSRLNDLVNPAFVGLLVSDLGKTMDASIGEAMFRFDPDKVFVRWGKVPPGVSIDPGLVKPERNPTWVLDIDASTNDPFKWSQQSIEGQLKKLCALSYRFFRWSVKDDFLRYFGGEI